MNNDQSSLVVEELMHGFVRSAVALDRRVEGLILAGTHKIDDRTEAYNFESLHRGESLFRTLDWKVKKGEITLSQVGDILGVILRELDRFRISVENSLFAITGQQVIVKYTSVVLRDLLEELISLFEYSAIAKGIQFKINIRYSDVVYVDRDLVFRMLANLLDNAIKYSYSVSGKGGERFVLIEARRHSAEGDWIVIIQSYGVGIDEDEIESGDIFKHGIRGKHAADRGRLGTGIGLAEAKRIADAHMGTLEISSQRVAGETFLTTAKVVMPQGAKKGGKRE